MLTSDHRPQAQASPVRVSPRAQVISTSDLDEARRIFSGIYAESSLEPERAAFYWSLGLVTYGPIQLTNGLSISGFRAVASAVQDRRYIVTLSGGGTSEVETGGERCAIVNDRSGAVLSPSQPLIVRGDAGFQGRNITIAGAALHAHLTALTGREPAAPIVFDPALDLESREGATLYGVARLFKREVESKATSPLLMAGLRDALLTSLLTCVKHSASRLLEPEPPRVAPGCVKRAEEFIEAHAAEPISLADIVAAAGVPARSLRAAFTARHGVAPMEFLRRRRFELARRWLIEAPPGTTVVSVVKALGLGDAGRFSVEYKRRFGQSPSDALTSGRAGGGIIALRGGY